MNLYITLIRCGSRLIVHRGVVETASSALWGSRNNMPLNSKQGQAEPGITAVLQNCKPIEHVPLKRTFVLPIQGSYMDLLKWRACHGCVTLIVLC